MKKVYTSEQISQALSDMARDIVNYHQDNVTIVSILKGGAFIGMHLIPKFLGTFKSLKFGFIGIESYIDGMLPSKLKVTYAIDLDVEDIKHRDVWIVDDIFETGSTMEKAIEMLWQYEPASIRTCVLIDKNKEVPLESRPSIVGLDYKDSGFLVGYGMGKGEEFRDLMSIYDYNGKEEQIDEAVHNERVQS